MKKAYVKPLMQSEAFVPDEYVAACYNYTADFFCELGENYIGEGYPSSSFDENGLQHGKPCSVTKVEINGNFDMTGHETGGKEYITISSISFCDGFQLSTDMKVGTFIPCVSWISVDDAEYHHHGTGRITSAVAEIPGRPNHS